MMFCTMYRWLISRSLDSGEALSARAVGHIQQCQACRDYRASCLEMGTGLATEARGQTAPVSDALHARILLRCGLGAEAAPPAPMPHARTRRFRVFRDVAAAAAVILVALAIWQFYPTTAPTPENPDPTGGKQEVVEGLIGAPGLAVASAREINNALDESMNREFAVLQESGLAAADFVLARIPIDVDMPR